MKRTKTIQDHLRYYRTYGGIKAKRRPAPPVATAPPAKPVVDPQVTKQAKQIQSLETRLAKLTQTPVQPAQAAPSPATKPDQNTRRIRALEAKVEAIASTPKAQPATTKPDQSAKRLRALETRLQALEQGREPNNGAAADAARARKGQ